MEIGKLLFSSLSAIHGKLVPYQRNDAADLLDLKSLDAEYLRKDLRWALEGGEVGKGWPNARGRLDSLAMVEGGMVLTNKQEYSMWNQHFRDGHWVLCRVILSCLAAKIVLAV